MAANPPFNPYKLNPKMIEDAPVATSAIFRRIGPGLILAASIVGSGELIATTVLGAENGYSLLWLILVSCVVKIVVQNELGRYAIGTGETTLEAFNRVPGKIGPVSWVVWVWFVMVTMTLMQIGGMLGGISEILNRMVPSVPILGWVWIVNILTVALLIAGKYSIVERTAMVLVVSFTALTVSCCFLLFKLPEYFSWSALLDGLVIQEPQTGFLTAIAAFGITGVGATELVMYSYWCIEKGYAQYTGARDDSPAWVKRAFGWIRVMGFDVVTSMVVYTFATIAFYLLGAGVLNGMGIVPEGSQMVAELSNMYTQTLGPSSLFLFLPGAFAVLYSTVFASTAAHSRVFADFLGMIGLYDKGDYVRRLRVTRIMVLVLLFVPSIYFMVFKEPVLMVKIGGFAQAVMLPIIGFVAIYLSRVHMPGLIMPKQWIRIALWLSAVTMALIMGYSAVLRITS